MPSHYSHKNPEYSYDKKKKKKKKSDKDPMSGINKILAGGGLGAAGLLISSIMDSKK